MNTPCEDPYRRGRGDRRAGYRGRGGHGVHELFHDGRPLPLLRTGRQVKAGLVDEGWKDTVLVVPGERVQALVGFHDDSGLFLYHCHMLEHEDSGLMRNDRVKA